MAQVFIPPLLRSLTNGHECVKVAGQNVSEVIASLDQRFPGVGERLRDDDALKPGIGVAVGTKMSPRGLLTKVGPDDEVHFLPVIGGG